MKDEIIIYQADQASTRIEVRIEDNTVWLSQEQMAYLFGRNRVSITQHIGNIFKEEELIKEVVCKEFLLTTQHGAIQGKTQIKNYYYITLMSLFLSDIELNLKKVLNFVSGQLKY